MMESINLYKIQNNQAALVSGLFDFYKESDVFLKGKNYPYHDDVITFSHTVLRVPGEHFFYIVSNTMLNEGGFSAVYPIEWEMTFSEQEEWMYYKPRNPIIAKVQSSSGSMTILEDFKKKLSNEYEHSQSNHLFAQKPVYTEIACGSNANTAKDDRHLIGIMVMNRISGINLRQFCHNILSQNNVSAYLRLLLTLELLNAFNEQVYQTRRVHGDLKPNNIILTGGRGSTPETFVSVLELGDENFVPAWKMKIIDFEGAEYFGNNRNRIIFTENYLAPEIQAIRSLGVHEFPAVSDEKPDLFSVGQTVAMLWGLTPEHIPYLGVCLDNENDRELFLWEQCSKYFEHEPKAFITLLLPLIYLAIVGMTHPNPDIRWGLSQSLKHFQEMLDDYNCIKLADKSFKEKHMHTHQLPFYEEDEPVGDCIAEPCIRCVIM